MADNNPVSEWGPEMDAKEHVGTYNGFIAGAKWTTIIVIAILVLMAAFLV